MRKGQLPSLAGGLMTGIPSPKLLRITLTQVQKLGWQELEYGRRPPPLNILELYVRTPPSQYFSVDNCAGKEVTTMLSFNRKPAGGLPPMPQPPDAA